MKVIFVVGTTASGKSDWAFQEALKLLRKQNHSAFNNSYQSQNQSDKAESVAILNCDSIQVYKGLNIGSAKPSEEEMSQVPHYLFSYMEKGSRLTAGQYAKEANNCLKTLEEKGTQIVFVVGGTGFYFQALEKGMYPVGAADEKIKQELLEQIKTEKGAEDLFLELAAKDPLSAKRISSQDHYRLVRALEIIRVHGKTIQEIQSEFELQRKPFPYPLEKIGLKLDKENLLEKIKKRTQTMLEKGLIEEVQNLINEGYEAWPALQSVGYKETLDYLQPLLQPLNPSQEKEILKKKNIKNLEEIIIQNTMKLAKKQRTWFQRDSQIRWL